MSAGFGIIGAGTWGETHAKAYLGVPDATVVGVADLDGDRARDLAQKYNVSFSTDDYTELLARTDVDAVSIATPDFAHKPLCIAAAKAGKHILVEKPLATTVADAREILATCATNHVTLMVDFHNRWNPPFNKLKRAIDAGEFGDPQMLYLRLSDTLFVPTKMLSWAAKSSVAWFLASHTTDLVRWLCNAEVTRVYSVSRASVLPALGVETPDFFLTTLELNNGAVALMENCWILSDASPVIFDFKCEFVGSKGHVNIDPSHHGMMQQFTEGGGAEYPDVLVFPEVFDKYSGFAIESIRHFAECVLTGRHPLATGEDGLKVTQVICALLESAEKGRPVDVQEVAG